MAAAPFAQHFLVDPAAINRIVASLELTPNDSVLEIGPGQGALTTPLVKTGAQIFSVEIDKRLVDHLNQTIPPSPNFKLVQGDFLEISLKDFGERISPSRIFKVVGNLPYNITSPILRKLSEWDGWEFAVIMVQKEVGDRLCAEPGTAAYGALTVGVSLTGVASPLFDLPEGAFRPPPKVKSTVVKLARRQNPLTNNIFGTQRVIQAAFQQRRKTILNSLSHGLSLDKKKVIKVLEKLGLDPVRRAETLSVNQFIQLAEYLS